MSNNLQLLDDFTKIKPQYAEEKDADQLLQMWQQTFRYLLSILSRPPGTYELTKEKVLNLIRAQQVLIWRKTPTELFACIVIKINKENKKASFGKLAVNAKDQKNGIGTAIVHWVEEFLKEKGMESIRIETYEKTPFLRRYYEKLGYNVTKVLHIRGENILELRKILK
ncbi:MAG: GNAT family N-acetyltransferase [Promethearchaeota archaeon]